MSQPAAVESLLEAFFQAREPLQNTETLVAQAEAAGEHQLAKIFRAVIASDRHREALMRQGLHKLAQGTVDFYVCPHCGLIYESELPEHCVADETPAEQFEHVS